MRLAVLAHDFGGVVGGTVVDHQDFRVPILLLHMADESMERGLDAHAFVIGGNDDGVGQNGTVAENRRFAPRTVVSHTTANCATHSRSVRASKNRTFAMFNGHSRAVRARVILPSL